MRLYLARHGNTFEQNEKPYFVGRHQDLALTKTGREQAKKLADFFTEGGVKLNSVYSASLKRTSEFAKIICNQNKLPQPIIDDRLIELDYGSWAGITNDEIKERYGEHELSNWNEHGIWPVTANWQDTEALVIEQVSSFVVELTSKADKEQDILVISSNGKLRYFLDLIPGLRSQYAQTGKIKVRTGAVCKLEYDLGCWQLNFWDRIP